MKHDIRNTPVSCDDAGVLALYEQALREYQSYVGDAVATIDRALVARPDFVLGHAFKAGVLMTFGEKRFVPAAAESVAVAERLLNRANDRERGLIAAARKLVDGDWHGACATYDRVLVDYPTDAFAIQTAHLFDFYRGDALNLRNRVSRVLPHWSADLPGWSYILGMHAFGLEECNQYPEAEDAARRALALEPCDAWAVHAGVHCMEMRGRIDEGIAWLETRVNDWAPDNAFAFHNWWHLALFHLDRGDERKVLELYDGRVYPQTTDVALQLIDATALLWRLRLLDVDVDDRFQALSRAWEAKLDEERGHYSFNDVHAMMAFAVTGNDSASECLLRNMDAGFGAEVGVPIARGLLAFERRRYAEVLELLLPVRDQAHRFGGSHAQRDLLTLTLIEAARRVGQTKLARHYLAERRVHRPASALGKRLEARLH
ncbi:MAG: tetratricopeptide repeat protein [Panacagrimonas sp.]